MYADPTLEAELTVGGGGLTYEGGIPASYGMDFLEVRLDPDPEGQPLTIRLEGVGATARFNVQVWRLGGGEAKPLAVTAEPEVVPSAEDGAQVYVIPRVDRSAYGRLALMVTRLDADETVDPMGSYRITLETTS